MKIGELAKAAGTQVETIRYYEREGLLPAAARTDGNYRVYETAHVQRLAFIRHCRSLDMTLDEVRLLLQFKDAPQEDCAEVNALLEEHIGHVASRIRELRQLEKHLKALREQCVSARHVEHCGILNGLTQAASAAPMPKSAATDGHIPRSHGRMPAKTRRR